MAEELQGLLDRIQREGVDKAEAESRKILDAANKAAADIIAHAQKDATAMREKAKQDADASAEKGRKSLEQAARDVILSVESGVRAVLDSILTKEIAHAMTTETLQHMLVQIIPACAPLTGKATPIEVLVSPAHVKSLTDLLATRFKEEARRGVQIKPDSGITAGFRLILKEKHMEYDFTGPAVREALSALVRPHIAEILRKKS